MSSRQPSIFNFVWFMTFAVCVGGLGMWAVGHLEQSPIAAARSAQDPTTGGLPSTNKPAQAPQDPLANPFAALLPVWNELTERPTATPAPAPSGPSATEPRGRLGNGRRNTAPRVRPSGLSEGRGATIYASPEGTPTPTPAKSRQEQEMVMLSGGTFRMGSGSSAYAAEKPAHDVTIAPFWLDKHEVTNAQFGEFAAETHYVTTAEARGWAPVFDRRTGSWQAVEGACWRRPLGPGSAAYDDEPVVQVSWNDAQAFAAWAGKRLPSEAEWEYAARGGLREARYPWGNDLLVDRRYQHNFWQGAFPSNDTGADGFRGLAPAGSYAANRYGLFDMAGNAWEWCGDWMGEDYYAKSPAESPRGPARGTQRVQRGGSWLCVDDSTAGFSVYSRMAADPDTMYEHVSFRCAKDAR